MQDKYDKYDKYDGIPDDDLIKMIMTMHAAGNIHENLEIGMAARAVTLGMSPSSDDYRRVANSEIPFVYWRFMRRHPEFVMQILQATDCYWSGRDATEEPMLAAMMDLFINSWERMKDPTQQPIWNMMVNQLRKGNG